MKCNYCRLQIYLAEAKRTGGRVVTKGSTWSPEGLTGTDLFIVPDGETLKKYKGPSAKLPNGDKEFQKYHKAWMHGIPYRCVCEEGE